MKRIINLCAIMLIATLTLTAQPPLVGVCNPDLIKMIAPLILAILICLYQTGCR
ncbi:MAG: hypothetical protein JW723_09715 [Bacteroidales bacterium]|nr:hypothetical protein [Bacteroidales bacterium]